MLSSHLTLFVATVLCSAIAIYLTVRLVRHLRRERRHDKAKDCACHNIKLLADGIVDAEAKAAHPDCNPKRHSDLGQAKSELLRLTQLRDTYYEEGASATEWDELSAAAESAESTARKVVNDAADDQLQSRLAQEAIQKMEQSLTAIQPINGVVVETEPARRLLVDAQNLYGAYNFKQARQKADAAQSILQWAEARAKLESCENALTLVTKAALSREIRTTLATAWQLYNSQTDLDEVCRLADEAYRKANS